MAFLDDTGLTRFWGNLKTRLNGKVDKEAGKGLSTNDFTNTAKSNLDNAVLKTGNNMLSGLFEPQSDKGANLGRANYKFDNVYTYYLNGKAIEDSIFADTYIFDTTDSFRLYSVEHDRDIISYDPDTGRVKIPAPMADTDYTGNGSIMLSNTVSETETHCSLTRMQGAKIQQYYNDDGSRDVYIALGNSTANANGGADGAIVLYSKGTGHTSIQNSKVTSSNNAVELPSGNGTLFHSGNLHGGTGIDLSDYSDAADSSGKIVGSTISLAKSGVTAGSYGPASSSTTGTNGTTIYVPYITVDAYGRVISISNRTYTSKDTTYSTTTSVTSGSSALVTSGGVYTAIQNAVADALLDLGNKGGSVALDNYKETGFFKVTSTTNGPPNTSYGIVLVIKSGNYVTQLFMGYNTSSKGSCACVRLYTGSAWQSWVQL